MVERYITPELAKVLKEIGFNEPVAARFNKNNQFERNRLGYLYKHNSGEISKTYTSAPTQSMVCDWIRETYRYDIQAGVSTSGFFQYNVWEWRGNVKGDENKGWHTIKFQYGHKSIQEAINEGIIFVFKLLGFIKEK